MSCVYVLTNKINNKKYVGQTTRSFKVRLNAHKFQHKKKTKISRAISKYGIDNFDKYVYECSIEDLDFLEIELIKILDTVNNGYNLDSGGNEGKTRSKETSKKISDAVRGENHRCYGKHLTEETRQKLSVANRGKHDYLKNRIVSEQTKNKQSKAATGRKQKLKRK